MHMEKFIETYKVKGYAKFDKIHNIVLINGRYIPYEDIDCFTFEEKIDVGTEVDLAKEVYSYVFAAAIPLNTLLDDNSTRRGIYVCTSLKVTIWLKDEDIPLIIDFLPKEKPYKVDSEPYQTLHQAFQNLEDAFKKMMIKLYGDDADSILMERLKARQTIRDCNKS